jgi:exonuclease III
MKIVTWNCNGAFRKKFEHLVNINADIYVIQECEDPERCKDQSYKNWASNYLWIGNNKNSGLGVFAKENLLLKNFDWDSAGLQSFIPFTINNEFTVLAVWTKQANSPTFQYIGQLWKYLQAHQSKLSSSKSIICGDFNSNVCWDKWDRWWNHSDVVSDLAKIDIHSIYHHANNLEQGKETSPTFYLHRKLEKPYHIDYAFASSSLLASVNLEIGKFNEWISFSDHMPVFFEFD